MEKTNTVSKYADTNVAGGPEKSKPRYYKCKKNCSLCTH